MLEPNGRQMLEIIGKGDSASGDKGILLPAEMPAAITALNVAVALDEQTRRDAQEREDASPRAEGISLRQRAAPFIDMLKRCHHADKEIVWGV
ncbi:MAG: DUF1840 domain-containing protein [Rhodoferax sp.]|nr:DUF1840 domain-containing protein [Rhodoferax sp.]